MGNLWSCDLETSIEIAAPLPIAWNVLTSFEEYSKWNRFLVSSRVLPHSSQSSTDRQIIVGKSRLDNIMCPPNGDNDPRLSDYPGEDGKAMVDEQNDKTAPKGKFMYFKPLVLTYNKAEDNSAAEFRWRGSLGGVQGLFDGVHYFQLTSVSPTQTRIVQGEHFSGLLVMILKCLCLLNSTLIKNTRLGFLDWNRRWKNRAERMYAEQQH